MIKEKLSGPAGGAEKVFCLLLNNMVQKGHQVSLLTFDTPDDKPFYPLAEKIIWDRINNNSFQGLLKFVPSQFIKRFVSLRKKIKSLKPSVVIVFGDFMNVFVSLVGLTLKFPLILSDRNNPKLKKLPPRWEKLKKIAYFRCQSMVVMTEEHKKIFNLNIQKKITVIPNPVIKPTKSIEKSIEIERPYILSVAKLKKQKGLDILIKAFSKIEKKFPLLQLLILGEGEERERLQKLIDGYQLSKRIHLLGVKKDLYSYYRESKIFVLSSRYEGFPNALGEAMSHGVPVIASDCEFGPRALVKPGVNGELVEVGNVHVLAEKMTRILENQSYSNTLSEKATEVISNFSPDKVFNQWSSLISKVKVG